MKKRFFLLGVLFLSLSVAQLSCVSVPHMIWPQKDIKASDLNEPSLEKRVLIASRSSEFKDAVLDKIRETFKNEPVYVKFVGLEQLEEEDGSKYSAIVMLNKCMSWDMDRNVKAFLKRYEDQSHMIVLTTSGGGDWMPKMEGHSFDAISSASKKNKVDEVANDIISKVRLLIQNA